MLVELPAPGNATPDAPVNVTNALARLLAYLRTWQDSNGLFGGLIATWWSSTLETAVAHPMNQYPIILGFVDLHRAGVEGGDWLQEARRVGDGLIGTISADGFLANSWGDIPGKSTGTVIHAAPAFALAELAAASGEPRFLRAAKTLLDTIDQNWLLNGQNSDGVSNQGFKWAEAMLAYARASGDGEYADRAVRLATLWLDQQIPAGPERGGIYQGRSDDRLISVYVGKCLLPLLAIYRHTGSERFLDAAAAAASYLSRHLSADGMFANYQQPTGPFYTPLSRLPRFDRLVFRRAVPTYRLWRTLIEEWRTVACPSFIARAADSVLGISQLADELPEYGPLADDLTRRLLDFQLPHGGLRNAIGYRGSPSKRSWQDVCASTRWNAYGFRLLASLVARGALGPIPDIAQPSSVAIALNSGDEELFDETSGHVALVARGVLVARLTKPTGICEHISPQWRGELTGARSLREIRRLRPSAAF